MAMNSRAVLAFAAFVVVLAAAILNVLQGATSLTLVVIASSIVLIILIWFLFDGEKESVSAGSTAIKTSQSIGAITADMEGDNPPGGELPDPLDAGFDVPLL
ncbi:MAG: hypothetical protein P8Q85_00715 [Candidatus Poseidoniaceae archaeon]|nr:hypothetical protein [Candidatus Poseidoniaceae archaeon]